MVKVDDIVISLVDYFEIEAGAFCRVLIVDNIREKNIGIEVEVVPIYDMPQYSGYYLCNGEYRPATKLDVVMFG